MSTNKEIEVALPAHSAQFLRRSDAAAYISTRYAIPCSRQTLAKYAVVGNGPLYRLAGRFPVYCTTDLDRWALDRLSERVSSTSAARRAA